MIGNVKVLARLFGLPYFPITPDVPVARPARRGPAAVASGSSSSASRSTPTTSPTRAADDPMLVFNITDQVRETIQHTLYRLLVRRRGIFR